MQITVLNNQSLFDIAIQEDGNVLCAIDWALANGISITEELIAGQKLDVPNSINRNNEVANYFRSIGKKIATYQTVVVDDNNNLDYVFPYELPLSL